MSAAKPLRERILVESYVNQKETITIEGPGGKPIVLYMAKRYTDNNRVKNPVIATVISSNSKKYPYIKEGDSLLVHHNFITLDPYTNPYCIEYDGQTSRGLFSIPAGKEIFGRLKEDGGVEPLCGNIIAKRLRNPIKSDLLVIPDTVKQEHNDRVEVVAVSREVDAVRPKQVVLINQFADYEICYTYDKTEHSVIKVWMDEILAIINEMPV